MSVSPTNNDQNSTSEPRTRQPVTLKTLNKMKRQGEKFACLAAYDATTARWLQRGGVHVLLAGDSAAQVILGHERTIDMPIDFSIEITAAIKRGAPQTLIMGDMPFMSYQADENEALQNAARFLTEGRADIVKLEGDASFEPLVAKMARAGIPVCAHVGAKPQHAALTAGYASAGRTADAARQVVDDALALERAGAAMLLVEAVPNEVADEIIAKARVPLIGIGAGPAPHGQILVLQDLLGMTQWQPGFATPLGSVGVEIENIARRYVQRVADRAVTDHRFQMRPDPAHQTSERPDDRSGPAADSADSP